MSETAFNTFVTVSVFLDAFVALAAVWAFGRRHGAHRRLTVIRLVGAVLATSAVCLAKVAILISLGMNIFSLIYVSYLDIVVLAPILALICLAVWMKRTSTQPAFSMTSSARWICLIIAVLFPAIGMYATFIEPFRVQFEHSRALLSDRTGSQPLRIGILADIQTACVTDHEHDAIDQLMAESPDIILIPGDLLQADDEAYKQQLPQFRELLKKLHAPGGVYFVGGDCEWRDRGIDIVQDLAIVHLHNEIIQFNFGDRKISIGGLELNCRSREAQATVRQLEQMASDEDIRILLSHRPDSVLVADTESRIDLVIAGHTHGGQVQIPFIGPLMTLTEVPRHVAAGGLHTLNGNLIYVSRGLGWEQGRAPRIRFLCPPEITMLTITDA